MLPRRQKRASSQVQLINEPGQSQWLPSPMRQLPFVFCDVYNQQSAAHASWRSAKFGSLCKCCCLSYRWGTYCYSGFYMTSVELSGPWQTVEGGGELETVNRTSTDQDKMSYFPGSFHQGCDRHTSSVGLTWELGTCRPSSPASHPRQQNLHFNNVPGDSCACSSLRSSSVEHGGPVSYECVREFSQDIP